MRQPTLICTASTSTINRSGGGTMRIFQREDSKLQSSLSSSTYMHDHLDSCEQKLKSNIPQTLPKIPLTDIKVKLLLGKGSLSKVFKVQVNGRWNDHFSGTNSSGLQLRLKTWRRSLSGDSSNSSNDNPTIGQQETEYYAMKCLNPKRVSSETNLVIATMDLAYESCLLAQLDHENIIKLHGIASEGFTESFMNGKSSFFILLEYLEDTLDQRLAQWRRKYMHGQRATSVGQTGSVIKHPTLARPRTYSTSSTAELLNHIQYENRISDVMMGVANGISYLHSKNIIFRDLKPASVGFTKRGTVRLFDFGLSRCQEDCHEDEIAGSYRYLAPECMRGGIKSSFKSDAYSFGVLFYEVLTLKRPYDEIVTKVSAEEVCSQLFSHLSANHDGGQEWRHSLDNVSCKNTSELIQTCWDPCSDLRPNFDTICLKLEKVCEDIFVIQNDLEHTRRVVDSHMRPRKSSPPVSRKMARTLSDIGFRPLERKSSSFLLRKGSQTETCESERPCSNDSISKVSASLDGTDLRCLWGSSMDHLQEHRKNES